MKKKKTQLLGIVLSAAMLATSVPAPVYVEEAADAGKF